MPVFVNTVVITGEVAAPRAGAVAPGARAAAPAAAAPGIDTARLAEEVTEAVLRRVEQALDRLGER